MSLLLEDRAFRVERALARELGVELLAVEEAHRVLGDRSSSDGERLRAVLSVLDAERPGTAEWLGAVAELTPAGLEVED